MEAGRKYCSTGPGLDSYFIAHNDGVNSLCFSPNGKQIATVGKDGYLKVWNFKPQTRSYTYPDAKANCNCVRFSPSGLLIAYSADREVTLRTPTVKSVCRSFVAHQSTIHSLDFSVNGEYLVTGSSDKTIKTWHIADNTEQFHCSLRGHNNWVRWTKYNQLARLDLYIFLNTRFSPDGRLIVSASDDCTVKIWDMNSRSCVHTFTDSRSANLCAEFHPHGFYIAACGVDKQIRLWDLRMLRLIQVYTEHSDAVTSTNFHHSGFFLSTSSLDNTVKLYDLADGRVLYTLHGHSTGVTCAQFSKQGDLLASGDVRGKVLLWRTKLMNSEIALSSPVELPLADRYSFDPSASKLRTGGAWTQLHTKTTDENEENEQAKVVMVAKEKTPPAPLKIECGHGKDETKKSMGTSDIHSALTDITQQLTLLTETISLLEKRLSRAEKKIQDALDRKPFVEKTKQNQT